MCASKSQYVSIEDAKAAARAVSSVVGAVVGTNVAVAVGTAVASSVSSAVAASSGGAVGGAVGGAGGGAAGGGTGAGGSSGGSSSGTLPLITQVQYLNQVGRIGEKRQENNRLTLSLRGPRTPDGHFVCFLKTCQLGLPIAAGDMVCVQAVPKARRACRHIQRASRGPTLTWA